MKAEHRDLYQRIQAFSLDQPDACFSFSKKLAKENGWSVEYTHRVIEEYKKFAFLAVVADHIVSPSDQVDQAWHLHLTYTRSYWQEFCPKVLQTPFHHEPSQGGNSEQSKFNDLYNKTLESYQQFFAQSPPPDIWPNAKDRFGRDLHFIRVNNQQNWILPKFSLTNFPKVAYQQPVMLLMFFLLAFVFTGCQVISSIPNPLNFTGPQFLAFYFCSSILIISLAVILRDYLRLPDGDADNFSETLTIYEMAYLAGKQYRVLETAMASLIQQQYVTVDSGKVTLKFTGSIEDLSNPVEKVVAQSVKKHKYIFSFWLSYCGFSNLKLEINQIENRLRQLGLLISNNQAFKVKTYPTYLILAFLALGIAKISVGISRGKPIGFLFLMCIFLGFTVVGFWLTIPLHSRYGDRVLKALTKDNSSTINSDTDPNLLMVVALGGAAMLPNDMLPDFHKVFGSRSTRGSDGGGDGGGIGGGCGGGGGDGGGGCGGCGGCGGGGM